MHPSPVLLTLVAVSILLTLTPVIGFRPWPHLKPNTSDLMYGSSKKFEGSSEFIQMRYHMGPVLTANVTIHIICAVTARTKPLPINPKGGLFLLLTSDDAYVQDFCGQVCGFHYFTFPSIVGYTLPYAWVGNSAKLCPDPVAPVEIADLCEGIYGTGGGGSYTGQMLNDRDGATFNMNGIRRRYLVQWVWNHIVSYCTVPNALDQ
ncbi:Protein EXORDIUM-like 3 [Hibiscus syriacus]|uniref:Protein EXORDIUM-like 3 n=1 Tax=Hibiscus syriacus TaxID=106335 RepID=A0A6A2YK73_HIBSY|nr:Protein EXORDIUM-like 3 [Hibiscus syriacus]